MVSEDTLSRREIVCHHCNKRGHLQRACKSKNRNKNKIYQPKPEYQTKRVAQPSEELKEEDLDDCTLYNVNSSSVGNAPPISVEIRLDDCLVKMEVDTGASLSLMAESTFKRLWPGRSLQTSQVRLQTYLKEPIPVMGCCYVNTDYNGQTSKLPLVIVGGSGPSLLGRDWLQKIQLDWKQINSVYTASLQAVPAKHSSVFQDGLGTLRDFKAKIYVNQDAPPRFNPARSVPYALRDKVEKELLQLQEEGTLEPVEFAEWAAPIVAVLKRDRTSVRICGDFSVTVNPVSRLDRYPIPKIEDLFAKLSKGKYFSKLDVT